VPGETFTTYLTGGELVELCTGGKEKKVTLENYEEFVTLVTKAKLGQTDKQMGWLKEGIDYVVALDLLTFLTWEELEIRACGPKDIDLEVLKKITSYNVDKEHAMVVMFWEVMGEFSQAELKSYLKFVWGRTKIPVDTSDLRYSHRVNVYPSEEKDSLPRTHTCYFTIDLPVYSNKETMKKRISTAFEWCGEIDDDAHYMGGNIPQEYGDEGGDY
jgi:E3 ubiquitin-protein ligase HERC1